MPSTPSPTPLPTEVDTVPATGGGGGADAGAAEGDSVLTIVARPGSGTLKPNAQHINNAVNLRAALYMFGGIAGIVGVLLYLMSVGTTKPQGPATLTPFMAVEVTNTPLVIPGLAVPTQPVVAVPPEVVVVVTVIVPTSAATQPPTATGTPEPSLTPMPTLTLTPTWTLTPTPTFRVDAVVGLKVYYEPTWAVESRTVGGLWPEQVKGFGAACPVDIPLGAWLTTRAGRRFVCVDRGRNLRCLDGLCTIVVYTDEFIAGLEDVQIDARPLNVGGQ